MRTLRDAGGREVGDGSLGGAGREGAGGGTLRREGSLGGAGREDNAGGTLRDEGLASRRSALGGS
ncbi:hypothetical protein BE08_30780 [Sorangium cellulosum]|uniref:Uncharacterized protein n=1 Tax=Sorangium cellulosum TaxID=56 RepID=A0A150PA12_SORCE|nr:hypothetical protein BE08_30780 [Sorangium cellulosum]